MPPPREKLNAAFAKAVAGIRADIPYLMHGAGDVHQTQVNPDTANLVATLTVQYMEKLVDAALDAHFLLRDSVARTAPPPLPPAALRRSRQPPIPSPPVDDDQDGNGFGDHSFGYAKIRRDEDDDEDDDDAENGAGYSRMSGSRKRPRRALANNVDYWDDPLPPPKIKKPKSTATAATAPKPSARLERQSSSSGEDVDPTGAKTSSSVHVDAWVGVAGVDLGEQRARAAYVQGPACLSTPAFLFPLCHDVYTYGRISEAQTWKRSTLTPLLLDPVVTDMVQIEGKAHYQGKNKKKKNQAKKNAAAAANAASGAGSDAAGGGGGNVSDPEDEDGEASTEEDEMDVANWPGLEDITPVYRNMKGK